VSFGGEKMLTASAAEIVDSGTCGKNVTWQLDSDGTFTVSGSGDMYDLRDNVFSIPWKDEKDLIKKIVIGEGITRVGDQNFTYCKNLVSVTFPDTLKTIGESNFTFCTALTSVVIPDSVTTIERDNFLGCKNLADVTLSSSVKVESWVFGSTAWEEEQLEKKSFLIINGTLLSIKRDMEKAVIPEGVVCIASQSCQYGEMSELVIPDSVKMIEWNAFMYCSSLKSVTVPASVETIKQQAFYDCEALEEICILNPECNIYEHLATTISNKGEEYSGVIKGYRGSTAEDYANKYGRTFVPVDSGVGLINDQGEGNDLPVIALGDVNFDGNVNAVDASMVLAYYAETSSGKEGSFSPEQISAADMDGNDRINAVDASDILAYYAFISVGENPPLTPEEFMMGGVQVLR
jgi:hypothetical protein